MSKLKLLLLLSVGAIFLIAGCSDNSTDNAMTEGDYGDEDFSLARVEADSVVEDLQTDNFGAHDWMNWGRHEGPFPPPPPEPYPDSIVYDSTSGWHVVSFSRENDLIQHSVVDSFRFTDLDSQYQIHPDSTTNIFERNLNKDFHAESGPMHPDREWDRTVERHTNWDGLAEDIVTLNGDFNRWWSGQSSNHVFEKTVDGEMTDIQFYRDDMIRPIRDAHPFDGDFEGWMVMDIELPERQAHIEAHLTVEFFEGGYHATLERGSNWWEWTHYWEP